MSDSFKLVTSSSVPDPGGSALLPPPPPPPLAPPPPPGPPGPPAPPPPMSSGPPSLVQTEQLRQVIKKCVPQPSNPLKSFNWSKLPECKVDGTIWTDIDDSRLYKQLDLQEVDRLFSAYQKNGIMVSCTRIKYDWSINTCQLSPSLSHSISVLNHDTSCILNSDPGRVWQIFVSFNTEPCN